MYNPRRTLFRIKPILTLLALIFLFAINSIVIYNYSNDTYIIHTNLLIYMYFYFWITFFLVTYQLGKIIASRAAYGKFTAE
jgi:hypothetical protein